MVKRPAIRSGGFTAYLYRTARNLAARSNTNALRTKARLKKVLFIIPVFTVGMSSYYALYDGITTNLIIAVVMTLLLWNTIDCLIDIHRGKVANPDCKWLCIAILIYCASEYAAWTVSCEWQGDTLTNPYFLFEAVLALSFVLFIPAVEKAVKK